MLYKAIRELINRVPQHQPLAPGTRELLRPLAGYFGPDNFDEQVEAMFTAVIERAVFESELIARGSANGNEDYIKNTKDATLSKWTRLLETNAHLSVRYGDLTEARQKSLPKEFASLLIKVIAEIEPPEDVEPVPLDSGVVEIVNLRDTMGEAPTEARAISRGCSPWSRASDAAGYFAKISSSPSIDVRVKVPISGRELRYPYEVSMEGPTHEWYLAMARARLGRSPAPETRVLVVGDPSAERRLEHFLIVFYHHTLRETIEEICRVAIQNFSHLYDSPDGLAELLATVLGRDFPRRDTRFEPKAAGGTPSPGTEEYYEDQVMFELRWMGDPDTNVRRHFMAAEQSVRSWEARSGYSRRNVMEEVDQSLDLGSLVDDYLMKYQTLIFQAGVAKGQFAAFEGP